MKPPSDDPILEGAARESADLRLIALAALAFLSWRDTGNFPEGMSSEIDGDELASALDRLAGAA